MKKKLLQITIVSIMIAINLMSCATKKPSTTSSSNTSPTFGTTSKAPCQMYDDDDWFTGLGIAQCTQATLNAGKTSALRYAQQQVAMKMKTIVQGTTSEYFSTTAANAGTNAEQKAEGLTDQIVDAIVRDTREACAEWSDRPDDKGFIQAFVGVKVSKKQLADKIADGLSQNQELKVNFDREQYRKTMEKKFAEYKATQNQ